MSDWTEHGLAELIRSKHAAPEWAFFRSVRNATGYRRNARTADGIAMSLYPSKGLYLHGFEIKCSRSDWQKEMQDPTKAHEIRRFCHFWWVVAAPGIVKLDELPGTWGLMEPGKAGLRAKKAAEAIEPEPMSYEFLASLLRCAARNDLTEVERTATERKGFDRGYESGKRSKDLEIHRLNGQCEKLVGAIKQFEEASGISINSWDAGRIGAAVSAFMQANNSQLAKRVRNLSSELEIISNNLRDAAAAFEADA